MNDLPIDRIPPNVKHLQRVQQGDPIPAETEDVETSTGLNFCIHPFSKLITKKLKSSCTDPTFGMALATNELNHRVYITSIVAKKSASKLFATLPATRSKIKGAFIVEIEGVPVFTKDDTLASFSRLRDQGSVSFSITFAPERKLSAKHVRTSANEYCLLAPATKWPDDIPTSEINSIKSSLLLQKMI